MEREIILKAEGVYKSYREGARTLDVLCGVDLTLRAGEVACLMGESGSGKTTLLNLLGSLDRPDQGKIVFKGEDLTAFTGEALARFRNQHIGFLFQFHYLLSDFTALENAILPGLIGGRPRAALEERARELFARVNLPGRMTHHPSELSGGEQQRVAMVRALVNAPLLVLADEPTGNLDERNSEAFIDLMLAMVRETGRTFLVATHSQRLAGRCDTVYLLNHGKVDRKI
ncbi:MAG: ABC transporter ATP-binding protein [Fibrobacterota bacterium]